MPITADAFDVQREIIGRKSKSHNFRRERKLVAAGKHVTPAIAPNDWLSLFAETQMNWVCCWGNVALFHGSDPLSRSVLARNSSALSKPRAIHILSLIFPRLLVHVGKRVSAL